MSLFSELQGALDSLAAAGGQRVTIGAAEYPAVVSQVVQGSEFLPGAELETAQLTARVSRSALPTAPALQSSLTYLGEEYRIETVTPSGTSFLLGLTALKN